MQTWFIRNRGSNISINSLYLYINIIITPPISDKPGLHAQQMMS